MLKSKFSLSRHFEYANKQITYHFWLCLFLRNSRRKSGVGKMNVYVHAVFHFVPPLEIHNLYFGKHDKGDKSYNFMLQVANVYSSAV